MATNPYTYPAIDADAANVPLINNSVNKDSEAYAVELPFVRPLPENMGGNSLGEMIEAGAPQPEYIGDKKVYSSDDPAYKQPRPGYTSDVFVLNLSNPKDLEKYKEVLDLAGTSLFTKIRYIERHWDESSHNWIILVELTTNVLVDPSKR